MALDGKVAIVTGAASGIGLSTARLFAAEGASVVAVDIDGDQGRAAAGGFGGHFVRADVGDAASWQTVIGEAEDAFGGVDIAHLNAGVSSGVGDITELTDLQYQRTVRTNVDGVLFGIRAVVPVISERGGGAVIVTSSIAGLVAFPPDPVYALTKHAVVGLLRSLVPQLQERGITINAVSPAEPVDTAMLGPEARASLLAAGFSLIHPDEIAAAVLACATGGRTGEAWICTSQKAPFAYQFQDIG